MTGSKMANTKSQKAKKKSQKTKVKVPEVMDQGAPVPVMDGTAHTQISVMQNVKYSEEIIQEARRVFNLERLEGEKSKGTDQFLIEGEKQILTLWHSIVALDTHNTMFVVLFLIAIGEILNQVKSELKPHEFAKWRREVFRHKHERYLVQAQQLANMGQFAKVYASMGKKRLLALDHLRREIFDSDSCDEIFTKFSLPEPITESAKATQVHLQNNPIPDTTADLDGDVLKEHVDAIINYNRLTKAGLDFVSFDQAGLLAGYEKEALKKETVKKIVRWLNDDKRADDKAGWFDVLVMNKLHFPRDDAAELRDKESLMRLLIDFTNHCQGVDFSDAGWIESQKTNIDEGTLCEANRYIKKIGRVVGIRFSDCSSTNA
jgi:hypothetical protein